MFVYSKKIVLFVKEIHEMIRHVLSREVGLVVEKHVFYNRARSSYYPISVGVYNHKKTLGEFNPETLELGFNESLMMASKEQLRDVVRHEVAHYITHINHPAGVSAHGPEFKAFCARMGWGESVSRATVCFEEGGPSLELPEDSILRKIQKLMALAQSSNHHEAEQAMIKSQQLLAKHNLEGRYLATPEEERWVKKKVLAVSRVSAKFWAISRILKTFFVSCVSARKEKFTYLEVVGEVVNVEIASYVAGVLEHELERLWEAAQRRMALKGAVAKNSFFTGVAKGYCDKIAALRRGQPAADERALMVIEGKLQEAVSLIYGRLGTARSSRQHCPLSAGVGAEMGRGLTLNSALPGGGGRGTALIGVG